MNDIGIVRCLNSGCYLRYDRRDFILGKRCVLFGVTFQDFAFCPLDREKMESSGFANLDSLDDIGVLHSRTVLCLAHEAGNRRFILAEFLP